MEPAAHATAVEAHLRYHLARVKRRRQHSRLRRDALLHQSGHDGVATGMAIMSPDCTTATTAHHCSCLDYGYRHDVQQSEERFVVSRVNPADRSIASMNAWSRRYTRQHVPTLNDLHQKHRREFALRVEENQIFAVNFQARRNHMLNGTAR
jgi:hypothetical protein